MYLSDHNFTVHISVSTMNIITGVAIALGILGSTYFEMGEFSQSHDLLNSSVTINRTVYGDHHTNTATAQTQLGNILRYVYIYVYISVHINISIFNPLMCSFDVVV